MFITSLVYLLGCVSLAAADVPDLRVGGVPVSAEEWKFLLLTRGLNESATPAQLESLKAQAIDRALIRRFLEERKVQAPEALVELRNHELNEIIRRQGSDPETLYARVGLTPAAVRRELTLGASWETYIEQSTTAEQLRAYFREHRAELDGTRVRVRQIFRKGTTPEELATGEELLKRIRSEIEAGKSTFEAQAREHSQSPSGERGGDVGWITGLGQLPDELCRSALNLDPGKLAGPLRTSLGVHLLQVVEREAGQLSLEDARPEILDRFSRVRWREVADQARQRTPIQRD